MGVSFGENNFIGLNKRKKLVALISAALLYPLPAYATLVITDQDSSSILYNQASVSETINSDAVWRSYSGSSQTSVGSATYTGNIIVLSGGIWQPMDAATTINLNGTLELYRGAILDLSYKYGENYPDNLYSGTGGNGTTRRIVTSSSLKPATVFHDGAILRLSSRGRAGYTTEAGGTNLFTDTFQIYNPQLAADEDAAVVNVQFRVSKYFYGRDWDVSQGNTYQGTIANIIGLHNITDAVRDNLDFVAETYYTDDSLHKYLFVPTLTSSLNGTDKTYSLDWTATRTELLSQGVFSAANAQLSMRNLWRMEDDLFWKRGEDLRAANRRSQSDVADGTWSQVWRGKYDFDGAYGSNFGQSYNGIQVGYDKQREGELFGGKLHTGLFLSLLNSDADFHQHTMVSGADKALYSSSSGDLKSKGIGLYTTWIGDKGHYLDVTIRGSKLNNKYKFYDSDDNLYDNDYSTWTYGAGFRYGYQKQLPKGWYLEPQVGLSYGTIKDYSYTAGNNMRYNQEEMKMLIGRFGVTAGRNFSSGDKRGTVYAKAAVNHDFRDGGQATADALTWNNGKSRWDVGATLPMDTLAGKDTWYEFGLGTTLQTGQDQNAFVELTKTVGGKVNTDWQVNAGYAWSFGGARIKEKATDGQKTSADENIRKEEQTGRVQDIMLPQLQGERTVTIEGKQNTQTETNTIAPATGAISEDYNRITVKENEKNASFELAPLVVEAARPDWEKNLSPGTVSVIHVPEYKGEMKNLPELLQTVPGVYVQRLSGTGHYTVARVRGATGGEVNIYVDGVLVNSNADAAVDLSTIPIENVERVEVYRGYVPARFAGAPLGGAINIVTKKPTDTKGSITTGIRSFNGYTGNLELTAPVGSGSMLFALNRDQAKGDFRYNNLTTHQANEPDTQDRWRMNNDYRNTDALLKWQDDSWFAKLTYKNNKTRLPESTQDNWADVPYDEILQLGIPNLNPNWYQYRNRQVDTTKTEFLLGRRQTVGNLEWGWKLDASYQLKTATGQQKNPNGSAFVTADTDFRNRRYEGSLDGSWKLGKNHLVEFLFNASREAMDVDLDNVALWPPDQNSVTGVMQNYSKYFVPHYNSHNYYFQVQDTMTLNRSGNLFFTPLFKAQKWDMTKINEIGDPDVNKWLYSYGFGLKKVQNDHWTFRGTYGTYYKFPNFYELFGDGVNVKSRWEMYRTGYSDYMNTSMVERGTSWDVSANWQGKALQADTDVTLTYFNRQSKNLSTYAIDFYGFGYYSNLAAGKIQGLELESKLNWSRWNLLLSATWNDSLITKSGAPNTVAPSSSQAGYPFPWIPKWETNIRLSYRFPGDKLTVFGEYHYLDKVGTYTGSTRTLYDSLGLTNVGLKYSFDNKVKLTAGVNDLFNKGPEQLMRFNQLDNPYGNLNSIQNIQYPQQGRTYYMSVQYFF